MKKGLLAIVLVLCVGLFGFWLSRDYLLERTVEKNLVSDKPMPVGNGWYLTGVAWEGMGWEGMLDSILSKGFFDLYKISDAGHEESRIQCFIGESRIYPSTTAGGVVWHLEGSNVKILVKGSEAFLPGVDLPNPEHLWEEVWLELEHFSLNTGKPSWSKDSLNPVSMIGGLWKEIDSKGTLGAGQQATGKVWVKFPNKVLFFSIQTEEKAGVTYLKTAPNDLRKASQQLNQRLTEAELELLSRYPLRLPTLFAVKQYASRIAKIATQRNPGLSEPAYRHLLWSYMLTREYGPEFAEKVTDAHEVGETGNTPQKTAMDLHNNALGRELFRSGVKMRELLDIAKKDPRVRRVP